MAGQHGQSFLLALSAISIFSVFQVILYYDNKIAYFKYLCQSGVLVIRFWLAIGSVTEPAIPLICLLKETNQKDLNCLVIIH